MTTDAPSNATEFAIFPCHTVDADGRCSCGRDCSSPGKHPMTPNGLKDASRDPAQQKQWWDRHPHANVGLPTGTGNNLVVMDIDPEKGGWDSLLELEEKHGRPPETVEVETGGDGLHLLFRCPLRVVIGSRNGWMPGIDIKAEGGYVIAPPSMHASGKKYRFAAGRAPGEIEIAELPQWLVEILPQKVPEKIPEPISNGESAKHAAAASHLGRDDALRRAQAYIAKSAAANEGNRDNAAFSLAGNVAAFGMNGTALTESDIVSLMLPWNLRNTPPLPESELRKCVSSAMRNGTPRAPKGMPDLRPAEYRDEPRQEIAFQRITSAELASGEYTVEFAIEGAMVLGQPLTIGGPMKSLKTSILIDAAISLASGGHFLGRLKVNQPRRVLVMSGESGLATIQETARRIAAAAGIELAGIGNLLWSPDIPRFNSIDHLEALEKFLRTDEIEILFCDPAYLAMPSADAGNLMAQGELLRNVGEVCQRNGVTLVLCHHTKRNTGQDAYEPLELQHLAWAGHAEFARQWWLVNRRERYEPGTGEHRLWLSIGGSAGHSSLWATDIHEGTITDIGGRRWEVELTDPAGARDAAKERQQEAKKQGAAERLESDRKAICEALAALPDCTGTKREIRDASGLHTSRFEPPFASLIRDKIVEATTIIKGNQRTYEAYKLRPAE